MGIVVPYLMGGLGNWLFQVAFGLHIGGKQLLLSDKHCSRSPHAGTDYFSTIFKNIPKGDINVQLTKFHEPEKMEGINTKILIKTIEPINLFLYGYFQKWKYIPEGFGDLLDYKNPSLLEKYPSIQHTCFLHVRGGDYVNHFLHDVGLSERYYPASIQFMKEKQGITKFVVFTNDRDYCSRREYLKDIDYEIIEENELDTLYLMTQCKGGITANSTFSWWGAYLNPARPICVPSKWFNDPEMNIGGYFFPGCFVQQV
jgi:hypothetical protein